MLTPRSFCLRSVVTAAACVCSILPLAAQEAEDERAFDAEQREELTPRPVNATYDVSSRFDPLAGRVERLEVTIGDYVLEGPINRDLWYVEQAEGKVSIRNRELPVVALHLHGFRAEGFQASQRTAQELLDRLFLSEMFMNGPHPSVAEPYRLSEVELGSQSFFEGSGVLITVERDWRGQPKMIHRIWATTVGGGRQDPTTIIAHFEAPAQQSYQRKLDALAREFTIPELD
ncbi:MAG: hypothetical protein ACFB21_12920 [Opitutales bacterium]